MKKNKVWSWWILIGLLIVQSASANESDKEQVFRNLPFQLVQQHGSSCLQVESRDFELNSCIYTDPVTGKCYARNRIVTKR